MGSRIVVWDGYQTRRRGSWIPGKERAEKVQAGAIKIDKRKEWICKFCSQSNVWTRWRWRRCYKNIPAGLRGKHRRFRRELARGPRSLLRRVERRTRSPKVRRQRLKSFGRWLSGFEDKEKKSFLEEDWGMEVKGKVESRMKLATEAAARGRKIHRCVAGSPKQPQREFAAATGS